MLWDEIFQPLQDLPKLNRAKELLSMHEELKDASKWLPRIMVRSESVEQ